MLDKYLEQDKCFTYILNKKSILYNSNIITHKMYGRKCFMRIHFLEKIYGKLSQRNELLV